MYRITKEFHFSASHQLAHLPHDHQCARMHGHNYIVEVELAAFDLNAPWERWLNTPAYLLLWSIPGVAALSFYYLNQTLTASPVDWQFALTSTLPN